MLIQVTAEDIAKGRRFYPEYCPVALAMRRQVKSTMTVGGYYARYDAVTTVDLPTEVVSFIRAFDSLQPVKPFSFEFNAL